MDYSYMIVQAGGRGSRLKYLTDNKPKCLVPVDNLPMLFHLFKKFPNKKFVIIGDYKVDVLEKYLKVFADVNYKLVCACGKNGTCAGIQAALNEIPDNTPFSLIWSDLILADDFSFEKVNGNFVALSGDFPCRWKYQNNEFSEERSVEFGVSGFFGFENKDLIKNVPEEGEFVRWLSKSDITFNSLRLKGTKEFGLLEEYNKLPKIKWRPFNAIKFTENTVIKAGISEQGQKLAVREKAWYKMVSQYNVTNIPQIYSYEPFEFERINGKNIYELTDLTYDEKLTVLRKIITAINDLHKLCSVEADTESIKEAYISKTFDRINKVKELIPFSDCDYIVINGKKCENVYKNESLINNLISRLMTDRFSIIHGDCTFSNMMLSNDGKVIFIDPRGYFGRTEIYGDELYDWAKLYYSIFGNYDRFNLKDFKLTFNEDNSIGLSIQSNGWENLVEDFQKMLPQNVNFVSIKYIHAIIWLSLTTYAWEDYDSICAAFYNGLWYLQDAKDSEV